MPESIEPKLPSYDRKSGTFVNIVKNVGSKLLFALGVAYDASPEAQQLTRKALSHDSSSEPQK
jgi:hypothetical protein